MSVWLACPDAPGWWWCDSPGSPRLLVARVEQSPGGLAWGGQLLSYFAFAGCRWTPAIMPNDRDAADLAALRELERRLPLLGRDGGFGSAAVFMNCRGGPHPICYGCGTFSGMDPLDHPTPGATHLTFAEAVSAAVAKVESKRKPHE